MKFFKVISILIVIFICLCVVWASDDVDFFNQTTTVSFEGIDFKIPEGFGEYKKIEDYNKLGSEGKRCFYTNQNHDKIEITIVSDWMGMSLDDLHKKGSQKTSIKGHDGWKYKESGLTYFAFIKGDNGILVGVSNQKMLSEVIL